MSKEMDEILAQRFADMGDSRTIVGVDTDIERVALARIAIIEASEQERRDGSAEEGEVNG